MIDTQYQHTQKGPVHLICLAPALVALGAKTVPIGTDDLAGMLAFPRTKIAGDETAA